MPLRGSVSSSLAQTGSFGRMQGRRIATRFLNVQSGSFGRVVATNFVGDGSQLTDISAAVAAGTVSSSAQLADAISGSIFGATTATASFGQMILNDGKAIRIQHPTENTSVFIGHDAGVDDDGGNNNIAIGTDSMGEITNGVSNIALGHDSLHTETTGDYNVAIGDSAMSLVSDADDTIAIGRLAGQNLRPGSDFNIFMGHDSGQNFAVGDSNIAIGLNSMKNTDSGSSNIAIGSSTLDAGENSTTDGNIAIGSSAISSATGILYYNIALGSGAMSSAGADGGRIQHCIAIGFNALKNAETGQYSSAGPDANIAIGYQTLLHHVTGSYNIAIGRAAMQDVGNSTQNQNDKNVAIGYSALYSLENGDSNVAIGPSAMSSAGSDGLNSVGGNVSIGSNAAQFLQKGGSNVIIGSDAAQQYATGSNNVILGRRSANNATRTNATGDMGVYNFIQGYFSGQDLDGGSYNVLLGYQAGADITTGGLVVAIGSSAARNQTTGGSGVYIGNQTWGTAGADNETVIGTSAVGKGANTVTIGDDNVTDIYLSEDKGAIVYAGIFSGSATGLTDIPASLPTFTNKIIQTGVGGDDNTIIGDSNTFAAQIDGGLTTSRRNVIIGADSGQYITTGDQNTVVGNDAMKGSDGNGDQASNVAIGYTALRVNQSDSNTAVGSQAGQNTTTGDSNVYVGNAAGSSNTVGVGNTYIGAAAAQQVSNGTSALGEYNTVIGYGAAQVGRDITDTVIIGRSAGRGSKQQGSIIIGKDAGFFLTSGSSNIIIGNGAAYRGGDNRSNSNTYYQKNIFIGGGVARNLKKASGNIALGIDTFQNYKTGSDNFVVGFRAAFNNAGTGTRDFGSNNIAFGGYAMSGDSGNFNGGDHNFFVGREAGAAATNCDYTIAIGYKAGRSIGDGSDRNIFLGREVALNFKDGDNNIAIGVSAMYSADSGSENIAIGSNSLQGSEGVDAGVFTKNIAIGHDSLKDMRSGAGNVSIGGHAMENAGENAEHLDDNVAIGRYSINNLEKGDFNIALGYYSMRLMQSGSNNISIGNLAMGDNANNDTGAEATNNVAVGYNALGDIKNGSGNIAIGPNAMNSVEGTDSGNVTNNVALGSSVLQNLEQGSNAAGFEGNDGGNFAALEGAMQVVVSGSENIAIGYRALYGGGTNKDGGMRQIFLGYTAGLNSDGGRENVAIGFEAGYSVQGRQNGLLGYQAGKAITTGYKNTCVGRTAGSNLQTGYDNLFLGQAQASATNVNNEVALGGNVTGGGTETVRIGRSSDHITNDFGENATWTHSSDKRIKKDIEDNTLGLEFINKLKTRTFKKKAPSEYPTEFDGYDAEVTERKNPNRKHYGFVAQEVKEVMDSVGHSEFPVWKENTDGMQELGETELITPLIKAVQELTEMVKAQQKEIEELKK